MVADNGVWWWVCPPVFAVFWNKPLVDGIALWKTNPSGKGTLMEE